MPAQPIVYPLAKGEKKINKIAKSLTELASKQQNVTQSKKLFDFIKEYIRCGNSAIAVKNVYGYTDDNSAWVKASQLLKQIDRTMLLELIGVTEAKLAKVLNDGLEAKKATGDADHYARHKYLETAYKLNKAMEPSDKGGSSLTINIVAFTGNTEPSSKQEEVIDGVTVDQPQDTNS